MSLPIESTIKYLIVMITTQFIAVAVTTNAVHDFVLYTSCTALSLLSLITTTSSESRPTCLPD